MSRQVTTARLRRRLDHGAVAKRRPARHLQDRRAISLKEPDERRYLAIHIPVVRGFIRIPKT